MNDITLPALAVEYADPAALGIEQRPGEATQVGDTIYLGLAVLAHAGVDPAMTRLVVTGDFVQSVRDRGNSDYHTNYSTERNTGIVAGKTMPVGDGQVEVLVHAAWFQVGLDPNPAREATELAARTILHEGQHVVLHQAGEASLLFEGQPWVRRNLLIVADQVIEEYRAEAVCARTASSSDWLDDSLIDVLERWLDDLRRTALVEYQDHTDVGRLFYDVVQGTHTVWKFLGYVAGSLASGESLPDSVVTHPLWQAMVEPHWDAYIGLLHRVPDAQQRTPRDVLTGYTEELADKLTEWLLWLGFEVTDGADDTWGMWIRDWWLLSTDDEA